MSSPTKRPRAVDRAGRIFKESVELQAGVDVCKYGYHESDFFGKAGQTLPAPWVGTKTGTSTNNVVDFKTDTADGVYELRHSADNEAQTMRLDWNDSLQLNMSKSPDVWFRVKYNIAGATPGASEIVVIGLGSAYNATLNSVATNAWFRLEGANLNIYIEGDDGTTDTDDTDTGIDYVDNTYYWFRVRFDAATMYAHFEVYNSLGTTRMVSKRIALAALGANTLVQPMVAVQRGAATAIETVDVDCIRWAYQRT